MEKFKVGVSLLLVVTLGCFVALAWSYADYLGYRDRILMSTEPIVGPFLWYGHTFNLLWVIGALACVWMWVGYKWKARSKIVVLSLLFIIGLTACMQTPIVKAESCEVDVVVALDEEFRAIMYWRGILLPPWTGRELAEMTVEDLQDIFYSRFNIVFNVAWVDWDSNDNSHIAEDLALEANYEIPHEGAMLWCFTNQEMDQKGQGIPWEHVAIVKWLLPRFWFVHINAHEIGHLFNAGHCGDYCVMNPDRVYDTVDFCTAHTNYINYWKWYWQEIVYVPPPHGGGAGGSEGSYPK